MGLKRLATAGEQRERAQQRYVRRRGGEEFIRAHERAARRAKAKRRKKKRRKITAGQASMKMYFQPRHTWRRSVEVSSDEPGS